MQSFAACITDFNLNTNNTMLNDEKLNINNDSEQTFVFNSTLNQINNNNINKSCDKQECSCDCSCQQTCYCNIFCNEINEITCQINTDIAININEIQDEDNVDNATTPILQHLKAMLPEYRRLILKMHAVNGHRNFAQLINDIQKGHHDEDPELSHYLPDELEGIKFLASCVGAKTFSCIHCHTTKIRANRHVKVGSASMQQPTGPMATGYMDLYGPFPRGPNGETLALLYICKDTGYGLIEALKGKEINTDLKPPILHWHLDARDNGWQMKLLHMDADPTFKSKDFIDWLAKLEINVHYAPSGQHWANSLIERFIQTVGKNAQAMLDASGLPTKFWFYALKHAVHLHNILVSKRMQKQDSYKGKSAYEIINKTKWKTKMPVFGQLIIAREPNPETLTKWTKPGRECIALCVDERSHPQHTILAIHKASKRIISVGDYQIIKNVYGWNMKPITNNVNLRVLGHFDNVMSSDSSQAQTLKNLDEIFRKRKEKISNESECETEIQDKSVMVDLPDDFQLGLRRSPRFQANPPTPLEISITVINNIQNYYDLLEENNNINESCIVVNLRKHSNYVSELTYECGLTELQAEQFEKIPDINYEEFVQIYACRKSGGKATGRIPYKLVLDQVSGKSHFERIPRNFKESESPEFYDRYHGPNLIELERFQKLGFLALHPGTRLIPAGGYMKLKPEMTIL